MMFWIIHYDSSFVVKKKKKKKKKKSDNRNREQKAETETKKKKKGKMSYQDVASLSHGSRVINELVSHLTISCWSYFLQINPYFYLPHFF